MRDVLRQSQARLVQSLEEANSILESDANTEFTRFLIRSDHVADAHGFRLWGTRTSGTGVRSIADISMLISCSRLVRR